jgi:PAS domain S-box-containing protein
VKLAGIYLTGSATLWTCVAWFLFAFMYTGRREWVTRRRLVLLSILPLLGTVGFATNSYTGLFLVDPTPKHVNGRAVLSFRWGIGTWLGAIHCWILSGIGFYVLLGKFRSSRNIYRKISFLHLVGALVLCGGPFFSFVGWSPFRYMVLSVVGILGIVLVSTAATISRRTLHVLPLERILSTLAGRWKDLTPMARDAVIQTMRTGVIVLDGENRIVDVNPIGKRMIGAVDRRVVGQTLTDIVPTEVFQVEDTSFLDPETTEGTFRGVWVETPDVEQYCFDIQVTSLGESDDAVGRTILVTDVTERENRKEKLETRTQELQRQNDQLEEFAGIVSHDLRNPLNVARGYLQVAKETDDVEPIEEADQSLDRMEMIIEDVLTLARQGQSIGETESVELEAIARDAWEHVDNGAADLEVTGSGVMNADPTRLLNLFENLYRNAIEHAGPDVSMTVGRDQDGFFVADDGQGIPEANQEEIFESGYTTEETGTGFGLAIVSQIAEAHGWSVGITDSETGGARFEFRGVEYSLDDGESTPGRSMIS